MPSSIYPLTVSLNSAGALSSAAVLAAGTGYVDAESVTLTGDTSGSTDATATISVTAGAITAINIVSGGTDYINSETLTVVGGTGSGGTGTATTVTISASSNILSSDITVASNLVSPGGGGIIRLSFGFSFATSPASISVFNGGVLKGKLNADNSNNLISDGYYRFDIDVEAGDTINMQASQIVNVVRFVRAHLVLLGA